MVWSLFSKPALTRVLLPEPATPVKTVNTCLGIDVLRYLNCFVSHDDIIKWFASRIFSFKLCL